MQLFIQTKQILLRLDQFILLSCFQGEFAVVGNKKVTLSHEFSGTIVDVGSDAGKKFKIGDRVGVDPNR